MGSVTLVKDTSSVNLVTGARGPMGYDGENGQGVPEGGSTGYVLAKASGTSYDTQWIKRNLYSYGGDYEPTIGHSFHGPAGGYSSVRSENNGLTVVRGTDSSPDTTAIYANTAAYMELRTASAPTNNISEWGNARKVPTLTVEARAESGFEGELNAGAFRAYSTEIPTNLTNGRRNLVGISAIASTNTGSGNDAWSVFGANIIASDVSGNHPVNCVGIECDLVHNIGPTTGQTVPQDSNNFSAYWAQSDANGTTSSAALLITKTARSNGWNFGIYSATNFHHWACLLTNTYANALGKGMRVEISSTAAASRILNLYANGAEMMRVTGEAANPVSIRVNSSLKNVQLKNFSALSGTDDVLIAA